MLPALKSVLCFSDVSKTAGATASGVIDTYDTNGNIKYSFLCLAYKEATVDVVSNKPTVLKLTEGETTVLTDATAIVDFTGGTATSTSVGFVIATGNTSVTTITQFNVDLRGRKRYIFLTAVPATTQIVGAFGVLSRGSESPATATKAGIKQLVES